MPGYSRMRSPNSPLLTVLTLTGVLWVVPSLGTQGMGTLGQRFDHPDRDLVEASVSSAGIRPTLHAADAAVELALDSVATARANVDGGPTRL